MPKVPKTRRKAITSTVAAIALSRFECVQFKPREGEGEVDLSLDIAMTPVEQGPRDGDFFTQVMCKSWRENDPNSPEAHFTAIYTVLFKSPLSDIQEVTEASTDMIASIVWVNFSNLFQLTNGQMHAEMPSLPLAPSGISVRSFDELIGAFDVYGDEEAEAETTDSE